MARMDPERRRKLRELARLNDEWHERYGVDDEMYSVDGASENRRPPTPEQEREFMRRARAVLGQDPDTGRYRD